MADGIGDVSTANFGLGHRLSLEEPLESEPATLYTGIRGA
jgi:hypothetical protein